MSAKKIKKVKTTPSSVCRVNKNANYTVMSNYHLRSTNLSLKAIGLLSKVLSLPENWDYLISTLFNEANGKRFKENAEGRWAEYAVKRDFGGYDD